MAILPILAGLIAALLWGLSDYLATVPSRRFGQYRVTAYLSLFSTLTMLPVLLYVGVGPGVTPIFLVAVFAIGAINFAGLFLAYRAYRYGNLSIAAPITGAYPVVAVLGSVIILHDTISSFQALSIVVIILGILLISVKASALISRKKFIAAGAGSALLSAIFLGLPSIFAGAYIVVLGYMLLGVAWRATPAALGFATGAIAGQQMGIPKQRGFLGPVIAAGVLDGIAIIAYAYGIFAKTASLPIIAAVAAFAGGVTVICALVMLKERPEKNQLIGIAVAMAGIIALSYLS